MLLPPEILCEIALKSPGAYFGLVQCSKLIKINMDLAMRHFTEYRHDVYCKEFNGYYSGYALPNGDLHSIDDKPSIISKYGSKLWHYRGKLHRDNDSPAFASSINGVNEWYWYGVLHRDGGKPASINISGLHEYWIHGVQQI
jgi:hypothetical protein